MITVSSECESKVLRAMSHSNSVSKMMKHADYRFRFGQSHELKFPVFRQNHYRHNHPQVFKFYLDNVIVGNVEVVLVRQKLIGARSSHGPLLS